MSTPGFNRFYGSMRAGFYGLVKEQRVRVDEAFVFYLMEKYCPDKTGEFECGRGVEGLRIIITVFISIK